MEIAIYGLTLVVLLYYLFVSNVPLFYKTLLGIIPVTLAGLKYFHKEVGWIFYPALGSKNPFAADARTTRKPYMRDHHKRDSIIKQSFTPHKVAGQKFDAVVVGSGIGGLTVAAILSKVGKRVLVLEQHDQAGGCCHTFIDKKYEFDVGIHYIGEINQGRYNRVLVDQITDGQLEWAPLMNPFDRVTIGFGDEMREFPIYYNLERFGKELKEVFAAEDHKAIDDYIKLVKEYSNTPKVMTAMMKFLPLSLTKLLINLGCFKTEIDKFRETTASVIKGLTKNEELQTVFTYSWGDYATEPEISSFKTQAALMSHFGGTGGWYPVGGASEIALNIIPVIERSGGMVLVNAKVEKVVTSNAHVVLGVQVARKEEPYFIECPVVVSAVGVKNTISSLLESKIVTESAYFSRLSQNPHLRAGIGGMNVFLGLNKSGKELDLKPQNTWAFINKSAAMAGTSCDYFLQDDPLDAADKGVPLLFISFPSEKDPNWSSDPDRQNKSTVAIVTLANWKWFESWDNKPVKRRGDEYERAKKVLGEQMIHQTCQLFPQIQDCIDYVDIGTPVTNNHYISSTRGEIYGLDHNAERFSPESYASLRPETDVTGLFMSGQDVLMCGFTGALMGGVLTSCAMLKRDLFKDIWQRRKTSYTDTRKQS